MSELVDEHSSTLDGHDERRRGAVVSAARTTRGRAPQGALATEERNEYGVER